jgi:hypothetical protein
MNAIITSRAAALATIGDYLTVSWSVAADADDAAIIEYALALLEDGDADDALTIGRLDGLQAAAGITIDEE